LFCLEESIFCLGTGLDQQKNCGRVDALQDRRGRTKPVEEMSELERLRAENRILGNPET
jgi:hypothetical protein